MILCVCNAISEHQVRAAARSGARDPETAYAALGFEPLCGCCLDYAQDVIDEELSSRPRLKVVA